MEVRLKFPGSPPSPDNLKNITPATCSRTISY
jgi:hypothetical protein